MRKIDLIGKRYGRLMVLAEAESVRIPCGTICRRYLCRCDCGTNTTSCGCLYREREAWNKRKYLDITGFKFGRLSVIKEAESRNSPSGELYRMYLCHCDCGAEKVVRSKDLKSGRLLSCGCYNIERIKESNTKHGHAAGIRKASTHYLYRRRQIPIEQILDGLNRGI